MMESIISIKNLRKNYGRVTALEIPALEMKRAESVGVVGNNGAGKTTLFRAILDLLKLSSGSVKINNEEVSKGTLWKKMTGAYLDSGFIIPYLLPEEYFNFIAKVRDISLEELERQLSRFESLFNKQILGKGKYIRDLSKGNMKKVGIAAAFLGNPDLVIMDEPFAHLDPSSQFELRRILSQLDEETDTTLIISSHDLTHVAEFCKRIIVLHEGKVTKDLYTNENTLKELQDFFSANREESFF